MDMSENHQNVNQDPGSRSYRIEVLGKVGPELWDHFEGEVEGVSEDKNGKISTILLIRAQDQAELTGAINLLNSWHFVIVSVNQDAIRSTSA